jgi:hypothetical protein
MSIKEKIESARQKRATESSVEYQTVKQDFADLARRAIVDKVFFNCTDPVDCSSIFTRFCCSPSGNDETRTLLEDIAEKSRLVFSSHQSPLAKYRWDSACPECEPLDDFERWCDHKASRIVFDLTIGSVSSCTVVHDSESPEAGYWSFIAPILNANGFDVSLKYSDPQKDLTAEVRYTPKDPSTTAPLLLAKTHNKRRAEEM